MSLGPPRADPSPAKVLVHVTATAAGLKETLDARVPSSGEGTFELRGERKVQWARGPFTLRLADGRVELKTDLRLEVELPVLGRQTVPIALTVLGEPVITSDWKARLQGAKVKLESKDLRLRTLQGVAGALETATSATEGFIEGFSFDLEPQVTEAYQRLTAPLALDTGSAEACATVAVTAIEAGPTVIAGGFEKDLAFVVEPSVTLPCRRDERPSQPPRLSNVATLAAGPFTVEVPVVARYDELAKAMSLAFTDGKLFFSKAYPELFLSQPEVFASSTEQLVVKLHLAGPISAGGLRATLDGDLFFAGHPVVVDNELRLPDLEPTVETNNFLLGLKAALDAKSLKDQARAALTLDLGERFAAVRQKFSKDVAFDGSSCLRSNVARVAVTGVYPHASYLRVSVTGQAGVFLPCPVSGNNAPSASR